MSFILGHVFLAWRFSSSIMYSFCSGELTLFFQHLIGVRYLGLTGQPHCPAVHYF